MKVRTGKKNPDNVCLLREKEKKQHNSTEIRTTTINVVKEKNGTKLLSTDLVRLLMNRSGNSVTDDADKLLTP